MFVSEVLSKGMIEFARKIPKESIIDIKATVVVPNMPVEGCTQKIELKVIEIWTVNRSVPMLPFQIEDASKKVDQEAEEDNDASAKKEEGKETKEAEHKFAAVKQDVRLNNRVIDLRVPAN